VPRETILMLTSHSRGDGDGSGNRDDGAHALLLPDLFAYVAAPSLARHGTPIGQTSTAPSAFGHGVFETSSIASSRLLASMS
jgi:hypothetical protein